MLLFHLSAPVGTSRPVVWSVVSIIPTVSNSDALRESVEIFTGTEIPYARWSRFEMRHSAAINTYRSRLEDGDEDAMSRLAEAFEAFTAATRRRDSESEVDPPRNPDPRWEALAEILTIRARRDPDVIAFRSDVLENQLVELDDVPRWIRDTAAEDGPTTWFVPDDDTAGDYFTSEKIQYVSSYYGGHVLARPIRMSGVLRRLRSVGRRLVQGFGWPEHWTVAFVLTDVPPPKPMIFGYTVNESSSTVPAMDWLELRVNPYVVSPRDLAIAYREIRSKSFGIKRVDRMSAKTAALAVHWERSEGQTLDERRAAWNRNHPEWRYPESAGNFKRDAQGAWRQATGEQGD